MGGKKLPWFKFYPLAWRADPDLRRCTPAARGVWIDLLCLAFECQERGIFTTNGTAWTKKELAEAVGGDVSLNLRCIEELLRKGVCSVRPDGAVYSRRMVDDERRRQLDEQHGRLGGNPVIVSPQEEGVKDEDKRRVNRRVNPRVNPPLTSSSLTSSSSGKGGAGGKGDAAVDLTPRGLARLWCSLCTRRRDGRPKDKPPDIAEELAELLRLGCRAEVIRDAILDETRDRGEFFWQFKERLPGRGARPKPETAAERVRRLNAGKGD